MLKNRATSLLTAVVLLFSLSAFSQQRNRDERPANPTATPEQKQSPAPSDAKKDSGEQPPIVTHHEIHIGGKTLRYTATTGLMPLRNADNGEVEAHIFY